MKNKLFKRLFIIVTVIILSSSLVSAILGRFAIRQYFFYMKIDELVPKINYFAAEFGKNSALPKEINPEKLMMDNILKIYDADKNEITKFIPKNQKDTDTIRYKDSNNTLINESGLKNAISPFLDSVLLGSSIKEITGLEGLKGSSILIGEPIINDGKIIGAIFLVKPIEEFSASLNGFYLSLFFSIAISLALTIILIYFFTKKLLGPLNSMKNAAIAMSKGDFSVRANENQKDEIGELANSLNYLASCLEENEHQAKLLEQTRRDYVANVSHELRTPIASVRAMAETLKDDMITDEDQKKKYYGMMLREAIRLDKLINDILELSRLQSGNMSIEKTDVSTKIILKQIIEQFTVLSDEMDVNFICDIDLDAIPNVYTNADRIMQVLVILLDNSLKYTISEGTVALSAVWDEKQVKISVCDTGVGIAKEDIPFIFYRFYKTDKSHSGKGTGLGLSIANEILQTLGEKIEVSSEVGKGSIFTFTIQRI